MSEQAAGPISFTIQSAAAATGASTDSIRDAINRLELPARKMGSVRAGRWLILADDLRAWVEAMPTAAELQQRSEP